MKTLKISNNNLSDINPRLALIDSLVRISIEGNPLKGLKPAMRTAGAKVLKEFLALRLQDTEVRDHDQAQAVALGTPGHSNIGGNDDEWTSYLREFVIGKTALDLKGKELTYISPQLWNDYSNLTVLELSNNPKLGDAGIPDEFANMVNLKSLRLTGCGLSKLPVAMLRTMTQLANLELEKNKFT